MATELIVNASLPETRVTLMEDGEIQELLIERATGKGIVGNIYKGRVTRVLPGMQAAFVDIGLEKAAFLYVDDVYVHSHIWKAEEGEDDAQAEELGAVTAAVQEAGGEGETPASDETVIAEGSSEGEVSDEAADATEEAALEQIEDLDAEAAEMVADLEEDSEDDEDPVSMGAEGGDEDDNIGNRAPQGTIAPPKEERSEEGSAAAAPAEGSSEEGNQKGGREGRGGRFNRRGKRGGRGRFNNRRGPKDGAQQQAQGQDQGNPSDSNEAYPESYYEQVSEAGDVESDRASVAGDAGGDASVGERPQASATEGAPRIVIGGGNGENQSRRPEFREQRSRDRRIRPKQGTRQARAAVNIQDLLKEGQEVIVQVAKDPIATKGARLTCHISLPGRHLVCMPTIDHVGVSRRIERDEERRRLREYVDRNRPKNLGFIVRTATSSGKMQAEKRIKQDIDYLSALWSEIRDKANSVSSPALVYEDLNPVLRAIRDWVNEEIDKIVVDSRYHYNEITRFVSNFMPSVRQKVELYQGDIPIFDAYNISTELSRALERKVWLKSGGYIVVDQAEALVAIDVNTGRYVGKKSLEDTILKTNLEAVKEIAYQLRLRNCGGIIILDLIDMEKDENKFRVYRALEEELKKDRARPQILKISELGLIEMTRKRTRDTIVRALCDSCSHCEGKGFIKSKQTVAYEILRTLEREGIDRETTKLLVQSHPDVIDVLAIDERETLDQIERRYRKTVFLQAVEDFHPEQFEVTTEKNGRTEKSDDKILERARESAQTTSDPRRDRNNNNRRERGGRNRNNRDRNNENREQRQNQGGGGITIRPVSAGIVPVAQSAPNTDEQNQNTPNETVDTENMGNRISHDSSSGDSQGQMVQEANGNRTASGSDDDFYSEEDRIAFLRAQAAQDAAIAKLGAGGGVAGNGNTQNGGRNNGGGGGGQNAGGRWGKNWRNRNNNRRGGRGAGNGGGGGGRFQGGFRGNGGRRDQSQAAPVSHDGGGNDDTSSNE